MQEKKEDNDMRYGGEVPKRETLPFTTQKHNPVNSAHPPFRLFQTVPELVYAEVFSWGMESGVIRYTEYIPRDSNSYAEDLRSDIHIGYLARYDNYLADKGFDDWQWKPYVNNKEGGKYIIREGDYIIKEEGSDIHFRICRPDEFKRTHTEVRAITKEDLIEVIIPQWYNEHELHDFIRRSNALRQISIDIADQIAKDLAKEWSRDLQGGFRKGYEKGWYARNKEHIVAKITFKEPPFGLNINLLESDPLPDVEFPEVI